MPPPSLLPLDTDRNFFIPRIFHRCWGLGDKNDPLPPLGQEYFQGWKELHPGWIWNCWDKYHLPPMSPAVRSLFDSNSNTGHRADIVRFAAVAHYGGVYIDADMEPRKPLDPLLHGCRGFIGQIAPPTHTGCTVETALFGAQPRHPLLLSLLELLPAHAQNLHSQNNFDVVATTGNDFFQSLLNAFAYDPAYSFRLFEPHIFHPYLWHQPQRQNEPFSDSYAVHRWWGSWVDN